MGVWDNFGKVEKKENVWANFGNTEPKKAEPIAESFRQAENESIQKNRLEALKQTLPSATVAKRTVTMPTANATTRTMPTTNTTTTPMGTTAASSKGTATIGSLVSDLYNAGKAGIKQVGNSSNNINLMLTRNLEEQSNADRQIAGLKPLDYTSKLKEQSDVRENEIAEINSKIKNPNIITDAVQSIPSAVGFAATGGIGAIGVSANAQAQNEALKYDPNISPTTRNLYGGLVGGLEMATEAIPLEGLKNAFAGKSTLKSMAVNSIEEYFGEGITELLTPFIKRATYNPDAELATLEEINRAGLTGAASSIMLMGLSVGTNSANKAIQNKDYSPETIETIKEEIEQTTGVKIPYDPNQSAEQDFADNMMNNAELSPMALEQARNARTYVEPTYEAIENPYFKPEVQTKATQVVDTSKTIPSPQELEATIKEDKKTRQLIQNQLEAQKAEVRKEETAQKIYQAKLQAEADYKTVADKEIREQSIKDEEFQSNLYLKPKSEYVTYKRGAAKELQEYDHKQSVYKAIGEGKKIPDNVIIDYPELKELNQVVNANKKVDLTPQIKPLNKTSNAIIPKTPQNVTMPPLNVTEAQVSDVKQTSVPTSKIETRLKEIDSTEFKTVEEAEEVLKEIDGYRPMLEYNLQLFADKIEKKIKGLRQTFTNSIMNSNIIPRKDKMKVKHNLTQLASYEAISNQKSLDKAKEVVNVNPSKAFNAILSKNTSNDIDLDIAKAEVLIQQAFADGRKQDGYDLIMKTAELATRYGREVQAMSMFKKLDKNGMLIYAEKVKNNLVDKMGKDTPVDKTKSVKVKQKQDKLKQAEKEVEKATSTDELEAILKKNNVKNPKEVAQKEPNEIIDAISKKIGLPTLTTKTKDFISETMDDVENNNLEGMKKRIVENGLKSAEHMSDQRIKDINTALVMRELSKMTKASWARKLSTVQAISHLLNFKTMGRNILGNTSMLAMEQANKVPSIAFDAAISKITGNRELAIPRYLEPFKESVKSFKESGEEIKLGIDLNRGKYDLFRGKTFEKGVLSKAEEALARGLKQPDEAFKGFVETQALAEMLTANKVDVSDMTYDDMIEKAEPWMKDQAKYEAKYATFQDDTLPSFLLTGLKDLANNIGVGKRIRGSSGMSTKEFGVGDLIVKYTRVPGNLISRSIEYTPVGYIKAFGLLANTVITKDARTQRNAAMFLGRATTGTGLAAMATLLALKNILIEEDEELDSDLIDIERSEGLGSFKLNLSALGRLAQGEDTTLKEGDTLQSYNWNQPIGAIMAIGSTVKEERDSQNTTTTKAANIANKTTEQLLDLPTLSTIRSMFYEGMKSDSTALEVILVPLAQSIGGFVPSPIRQSRQLFDNIKRETKGDNIIETGKNKLLNAIPFASKTLEPNINSYGKEVTYDSNILDTFFNPAIATKYTPNELTAPLKALAELTGNNSIIPQEDAPNFVTLDKKKVYLTPEEKTEYQKIFGSIVTRKYTPKLKNLNTNKPSPALLSLAKELVKIRDAARTKAKETILDNRK